MVRREDKLYSDLWSAVGGGGRLVPRIRVVAGGARPPGRLGS